MKNSLSNRMRILFLFSLLSLSFSSFAQGRQYIRDCIKKWGECRNVAITKTNGDLALYGDNGFAYTGIPLDLNNAIKELRENHEYIDDIQLTERGRWLILYGNNGMRWNDIPYSLERVLRDYNNDGEVITTVTFNDDGDWIVITTEHISASHDNFYDWIKDGMYSYGNLWTACMTDDGLVAVFEHGYSFLGNVPEDLKTALKQTSLNVYRLKIAGTAWFFADLNGSYKYNM